MGLVLLCRLLGITRQAYYQHVWQQQATSIEQTLVLEQVLLIRKFHRSMGGRKLYELLQPFMLEHHIKMGRDALFDLLAANGLLVKKKRRRSVTTFSNHWLRKWPNLIRQLPVVRANQLWVSEITYWRVGGSFMYISLVTDAYSLVTDAYSHKYSRLSSGSNIRKRRNAQSATDGFESIARRVNAAVDSSFCTGECSTAVSIT